MHPNDLEILILETGHVPHSFIVIVNTLDITVLRNNCYKLGFLSNSTFLVIVIMYRGDLLIG